MPLPAPLALCEDATLGLICHDGDVSLQGSLREGRPVQVGGSLTVSGTVEAVQLSAGGTVRIGGGIVGKQTGRYTIGGDLHCGFVRGGQLMVRGDLFAATEIADSRITCSGRLDVHDGALAGGDVASNGGIACRALGRPGGGTTNVEAGDGRTMRLLGATISAQVDENRRRVSLVRASVEPLLKQMKSLSPQQREKATELLYEADELETTTANLVAALEARQRKVRERAKPEIVVTERVYAGVVVRFGQTEATIAADIEGPLTLTCRKTDVGSELIAIQMRDGSVRVLPSRSVDSLAAAA